MGGNVFYDALEFVQKIFELQSPSFDENPFSVAVIILDQISLVLHLVLHIISGCPVVDLNHDDGRNGKPSFYQN